MNEVQDVCDAGIRRVIARWFTTGNVTVRKVAWDWIDSKCRVFLDGIPAKSPKTCWVVWDATGYYLCYGNVTLTGHRSELC